MKRTRNGNSLKECWEVAAAESSYKAVQESLNVEMEKLHILVRKSKHRQNRAV